MLAREHSEKVSKKIIGNFYFWGITLKQWERGNAECKGGAETWRRLGRELPAVVAENRTHAEDGRITVFKCLSLIHHYFSTIHACQPVFWLKTQGQLRRGYSRILAQVYDVAMATGLVKIKAYKMILFFQKKSNSQIFSLFDHHEFKTVFVIRRKPSLKFQIFCDRSFAWFLNYFLARFLESELRNGSRCNLEGWSNLIN